MSNTTALLLSVLLLAGNAFFVGAEFAVMSVRRSQLEPLVEAKRPGAATALYAVEHVSQMLATAQLGVTVCSTSLGALAEPAIAHLLYGPFEALGLPAAASHVVAFVIALSLVVYLHVVTGEMVPKNLVISMPERAVLYFGPPLVWLSKILAPIIWVLNEIANHVLRLIGITPRNEVTSAFTADEVASIVEVSQAEGVLHDDVGLLSGALEFSAETAASVMVPLEDLVTVPPDITPEQLEREVARTGYSRFPVKRHGDLMGYLHVKDVLYAQGEARTAPVQAWRIRPLAEASPSDEVEDSLHAMQRTGAHLAVVRDGGTTLGVVFLEDILEELVGEVRDSMQREDRIS